MKKYVKPEIQLTEYRLSENIAFFGGWPFGNGGWPFGNGGGGCGKDDES